jgi:hypothetical protein
MSVEQEVGGSSPPNCTSNYNHVAELTGGTLCAGVDIGVDMRATPYETAPACPWMRGKSTGCIALPSAIRRACDSRSRSSRPLKPRSLALLRLESS